MSTRDEEHFFKLVRQRSGLSLTSSKMYLLRSRLQAIAVEERVTDVPALLARIRMTNAEGLIRRCVDALATHETFFFRDGTPFDQLRSLLPGLVARRQAKRSLRIWSAACSSGQEPYSIAMLIREFPSLQNDWRVEIVATDMSEGVLAKARAGLFNAFEVGRGLTDAQRARWMSEVNGGWELAPAIRSAVSFRKHNLMDGTAALGGLFDVIFCRNVLIYLEQADKAQVLAGLAAATAQDGALFLGAAETVFGLTDQFEARPGLRGCYQRRAEPPMLKSA